MRLEAGGGQRAKPMPSLSSRNGEKRMSYISFENVKKEYKMGEITIKAVDGVDFAVEKGEFTIIVGPSGAGKTTVLNMLGGMDACS